MGKIKNTHKVKRSKKPFLAGATAIVTVAAMLGGAFAWTDFTQSKTNRFNGTFEADVTLHDEFDGVNKDVFVENSGTNIIYVRVRLDEFMQAGSTVFDSNSNVRDKTTWTPHTYDGADIGNCGGADAGKYHDYYQWQMTGADRDYTPGTPGMVYDGLGADGKVSLADASGATPPHHTAAAGTPVKISEFLRLQAETVSGMSSADRAEWDKINTGCWLLDDSDTAQNGGGWAYWSVPLSPDAATNLLLDEVTNIKRPSDNWIYRIDVKLQAVTAGDFSKWDDTSSICGYRVTSGARQLIGLWTASV